MQVCEGVQHAHQKGIIHRDLKPSNVLVALQDDRPVPKIIDFGVAKATTRTLTDSTMHTEFGAMIGTPEYMSPEQAEMTGLDVDTRTDVYSLGVILYELLTGDLPVRIERRCAQGLDEIRRTIREVEPPRPSTRVTTLAATPRTRRPRAAEAPRAGQRAARRSRLDHDEGAGEGSDAALRRPPPIWRPTSGVTSTTSRCWPARRAGLSASRSSSGATALAVAAAATAAAVSRRVCRHHGGPGATHRPRA